MVTNQKATGRASSMPVGLSIGAGVSLGITLLGTAVLAKLLDMQTIPWDRIGYAIMALLIVASMTGAVISYKRIKHRRMMVCMISGGIYFGLLMSITALFFGGQYEAVGVTAMLVLGSCAAVGLMGMGNQKKRRQKIIRHR